MHLPFSVLFELLENIRDMFQEIEISWLPNSFYSALGSEIPA